MVGFATALLSLSCVAEPVEQEGAAEEQEVASAWEDPLGAREDDDPEAAAQGATVDAVIEHQAALDRHAVTLQTYLGRPPTWIQTAARVNLGEFPDHADPTDDADHALRTLEWLAELRNREPAERPGARQPSTSTMELADGEATWLDLLLPSTWLPMVREHRQEVVAVGVALLLTSWLLPHAARAWRRRGRRRRRRGGSSSRRHRIAGGAAHALDDDARRREAALAAERAMRPRSRRRRRHRSGSSAAPSLTVAPLAKATTDT